MQELTRQNKLDKFKTDTVKTKERAMQELLDPSTNISVDDAEVVYRHKISQELMASPKADNSLSMVGLSR